MKCHCSLTMPLREGADSGTPLVVSHPNDPAAQAVRQAARRLMALAPAKPIALPTLDVVQVAPPPAAKPLGMSLPMA